MKWLMPGMHPPPVVTRKATALLVIIHRFLGYEKWSWSLPSDAYEKIAGSPCFTRVGTKLAVALPAAQSSLVKSGEMADIVNAAIVYSNDNSTQSHLSQEDSSCYGDAIPILVKAKVRKKPAAGVGSD